MTNAQTASAATRIRTAMDGHEASEGRPANESTTSTGSTAAGRVKKACVVCGRERKTCATTKARAITRSRRD